jgi:hypothetical protein
MYIYYFKYILMSGIAKSYIIAGKLSLKII